MLTPLKRHLNRIDHTRSKGKLPPLLFMTDSYRGIAIEEVIHHLPKNAAVIFREYTVNDRKQMGKMVQKLCKKRQLPFLVAGDISLAVALQADGMHFPGGMLQEARKWKRHSAHKFLTLSLHHKNQLKSLTQLHPDALIASPIFPTKSHIDKKATGSLWLASLAQSCSSPLYALGGIDNITLPQLQNIPLCGFAGISLFRGFL